MDIIVFIISYFIYLLAEVSGVTELPIPAFNASACTVPGGDYSTCPPGYSMDCSKELSITSRPCCFCPEGTYLADYNNCTHCTAYKDCTGKEITFEGNITTDRECDELIKVPTVPGVLEEPTLPPPNSTSTQSRSSTGSPAMSADGTTRGEPPVGEASTIFGCKTWVVILAIVIVLLVLLLLYISRKKIRNVFLRCRGRGAEKMSPIPSEDLEPPTPMTEVPAEATDDVEQTEQLADAGANT